MGGALSLVLATVLADTEQPLQAAVTCYGTPSADAFDMTKITNATAVQGHFGGKDSMAGFSDPAAGMFLCPYLCAFKRTRLSLTKSLC